MSFSMPRMHLCGKSAVLPNINGQPPAMTRMFRCRQAAIAFGETLPSPKERCSQTRWMPSSAQSSTIVSATVGVVATTTPSIVSGIDARAGPRESGSRETLPPIGAIWRAVRCGVKLAAACGT